MTPPVQLNRRLGLQPVLDLVEGKRPDPESELRLRCARLHAEDLHDDVSRPAFRSWNLVHPPWAAQRVSV